MPVALSCSIRIESGGFPMTNQNVMIPWTPPANRDFLVPPAKIAGPSPSTQS